MAAANSTLDPDLLREVLECPICLETYNPDQMRPKLLQCGHTVCRQCLEKLLATTINGVRCPFCSKVSRMSSISQLADNLTVLKVLDCSTSCSSVSAALMCRSCRNRLPRQYCRNCATVLCELCKEDEHLHHGHSVEPIRAAADRRRKELCGKLSTLRNAMGRIQKKKTTIENVSKSLMDKYQAVQQEYASAEFRLHEELKKSRTTFFAALVEVEKLNRHVLDEQAYLLSIAEVKALSRYEYLTMLVRQSDIALLKDDGKEEEEEEDLDIGSCLPTVFKLQEPELIKVVQTKPVEVGHVNKNSFTVSTDEQESDSTLGRDVRGLAGGAGAPAASGDLYHDVDMIKAGEEEAGATCCPPGSFKSKSMDEGRESAAGEGDVLPGCGFVKKMGCKGSLPGMFNLPVSICVSTVGGEVLVADRGNCRVQIFNRKGFQREIRRNASSIDTFVLSFLGADPPNLSPLCIAVSAHGLIGVTDNHDNSVKFYTMEGHCVACHKSQLVKPWGIATTPSGHFVVSDVEGGKLWCLVVDRDIGVVSYNRLCSAVRPKFVTCDAAGTVYFTQGLALNFEKRQNEPQLEGGFSIGSVNSEGQLGKQLSHFFSETEDFRCITGMCVDANGDLLVADSGRREILQFPKAGGFKILIKEGLACPVGVATTLKGQLLVLDCWDHCVKVYTYTQRRHSSTS